VDGRHWDGSSVSVRTIAELVQDLKHRREVGDLPPVVFLGAGASVEAGVGAMRDLIEFVGRTTFEEFSDFVETRTAAERYRLLARFLQARQPSAVTPGYRALASLCADAFFDLILTTNLDPLLEDALADARLWRKDYLLLVNGVVRTDWLRLLLSAPSPRVKVVKLHGDLFHRCMAWTPVEMDDFIGDIAAPLKSALANRDVLVVGLSLRDPRIRELVLAAGDTIWFVTPSAVPDFLTHDDRVRAVVGSNCTFERLFIALADGLGVERDPSPLSSAASTWALTTDDLMSSVVALTTPDGNPAYSGFVLANPRVVVTDGYSGTTHISPEGRVTLIAADQSRYDTRVLKWNSTSPFGPVMLEVPRDLKVPGLHLDPQPLSRNLSVRIGVAAGHSVGVSSGTVSDPRERDIEVVPIGLVRHLVAVECTVAPGAAGAPVVDDAMAVRGFVAAGGVRHPPALVYPAYRWIDALR
jgi:hypothetical protein